MYRNCRSILTTLHRSSNNPAMWKSIILFSFNLTKFKWYRNSGNHLCKG